MHIDSAAGFGRIVLGDNGIGQREAAVGSHIDSAAGVARAVLRQGTVCHFQYALDIDSAAVGARLVIADSNAVKDDFGILVDIDTAAVVRPAAFDGAGSNGILNRQRRAALCLKDYPDSKRYKTNY